MEPEIQHLFREAVELFNEGDLKVALGFFRTYLRQGGAQQAESYQYLKRIGEQAVEAAKMHSQHGHTRRAREYFTLAIDAGGAAAVAGVKHLEAMVPVPVAPKLPEFRSPKAPISTTGRRLWRRPHMAISKSVPLAPGDSFLAKVYADQSDPRPGEETEKIELFETGIPFYDLEVRLLTSAHFRLEGPATQAFRIEQANPVTKTVDFSLQVLGAAAIEKLAGKPVSLCAEFLYQGRPSGKVTLRPEVAGTSAAPAAEGSKERLKERNTIIVDPIARPADLMITITKQAENDNRHFWCTVTTSLLPKYENGITAEWNPPDVTNTLVSGYMREFTKPGLSKIERLAKLRGAGKELYKVSPDHFKDVLWNLIDSHAKLTTIAILSDEPFVPWELMVPHRETGPKLPPEFRDPLGVEFRVGRMTRRWHVAGAQKIPLSESYVVAPVFEGPRSLPHAQEEAAFVTGLFPGARIDPANFDTLNAKLNSCRSLLHFACHGEVTDEGKQVLYLDAEKEFSATDLSGLPGPEKGIPVAQPLVFLNACQVGRPVPGLVGVGGFAATFAEMGACAVVAPLWSVKDTIAHEIAMDFYRKAKYAKSVPLAEVLRQQRAKAYDPAVAEDTYAAYCFYGDPLAVTV
jgi:hypothetical protein